MRIVLKKQNIFSEIVQGVVWYKEELLHASNGVSAVDLEKFPGYIVHVKT